MYIDLDEATPTQAYFHTSQTLIPRPIAWVLSENADGGLNLAPFSYFTAVCSDPPLLMLSIGRRPDGSPKDTWANIAQRNRFVVHIAHAEMLASLNASAASLPPGQSEVAQLELATTGFEGFSLPRLAQCRIAYACEKYDIQEVGKQRQGVVFGRIRKMFLDERVAQHDDNGRLKVDSHRLDPLARLGANEYLVGGEVVKLKRPK